MSFDTEVLIIGAGMSGLGLAIQIIRKYGIKNFELVEKGQDVGGTWLANTYPGCGCDVASHFYSYSFALNPNWTRKYSMQSEIQAYFRSVAEQYRVIEHIRFQTIVEKAVWDDVGKVWVVSILDLTTKTMTTRRAKILISGVGSLSVPRKCEVPGVEKFKGPIFHSAEWDHTFDWKDKDLVVIGNGCSATQFLPIMVNGPNAARTIVQFGRQAQYLSERTNPTYSPFFKAIMKYTPFAMRIYRFKYYYSMESDFSGFSIESGRSIRQRLARENAEYVKSMAPERYWNALIPKTEIGCKRKVLDTDYLKSLWKENVELVSDDTVERINEDGVVTRDGRNIKADAVVLAIGFATQQMLTPMEILGRDGVSLNSYWDTNSQGIAQAYFGTTLPSFPNFFILMGPNTVTGHLSVIYTVECQINFTLRLLDPIIKTLPSYLSKHKASPYNPIYFIPPTLRPTTMPMTVEVLASAALADHEWTQRESKKLVWASGCTNWAVDAKTGLNNMMYPDWQFFFWWRSVFWRRADFVYKNEKTGEVVRPGEAKRRVIWGLVTAVVLAAVVGRGWFGRWVKDVDMLGRVTALLGKGW